MVYDIKVFLGTERLCSTRCDNYPCHSKWCYQNI